MQPTCGFLIGLIPTAWLIGLLTAKRELRPLRTAAACLAGLAMLYAVGLPYMAAILNGYMGRAWMSPPSCGPVCCRSCPGTC